jgi:hypothetical protein
VDLRWISGGFPVGFRWVYRGLYGVSRVFLKPSRTRQGSQFQRTPGKSRKNLEGPRYIRREARLELGRNLRAFGRFSVGFLVWSWSIHSIEDQSVQCQLEGPVINLHFIT